MSLIQKALYMSQDVFLRNKRIELIPHLILCLTVKTFGLKFSKTLLTNILHVHESMKIQYFTTLKSLEEICT